MGNRLSRFTKRQAQNSLAERARKFLRDAAISMFAAVLGMGARAIEDLFLGGNLYIFYLGSTFYTIGILMGAVATFRAIWLAELTLDEANSKAE